MSLATCSSTSYYLLWFLSVFLASRLGSITVHSAYGGWGRRKRGMGLTSSITAQTARQPFETQWYKADPRITPDNLALSCHVLKRLIRNFWGTALYLDASHSSHIFFSGAPLFFPRWPSHIKAQPWILSRKWAENCVLCSLSWYAGETIKEETDRAIREAPGPVSCCSRAGKALWLWRGTSNVREQQSTRDLQQDIQGFEPSPRSLIYLCRVIPKCWYNSAEVVCNA